MDKLWDIQTTESDSVLKGNELASHEKTKRKLKYIVLNKRNQYEKGTCYFEPNYMINS